MLLGAFPAPSHIRLKSKGEPHERREQTRTQAAARTAGRQGETGGSAGCRTASGRFHTLRRAGILWFVMIAAFVYLLVRIPILQTGGYEKYRNKVLSQLTTESSVTAERGRIYDTNRTVLATNVTTYRVFISPAPSGSTPRRTGRAMTRSLRTGCPVFGHHL